MAAVLSADMNNTDRIVRLIEEVRRMKLVLQPPSINASGHKFRVVDNKTILFGLGAVKGAGSSAILNLCEERRQHGQFSDLFDFCRRIDPRKVNRRVIEALIRAGALDDLGQRRSVLAASLEKALKFAEQYVDNTDSGQDDMFGTELLTTPAAGGNGQEIPYVSVPEWQDHERLMGEKESLGFYLKGHPITRYEDELSSIISAHLNKVKAGMNLTVAGYIESIRIRTGARGRLAEVMLDDRTARLQITVYSENYQLYRDVLVKDQLVIIKGDAVEDDYYESGVAIVAREVYTLAALRERYAALRLKVCKSMLDNGFVPGLKEVLSHHASGTNRVFMEYNDGQVSTILSFGSGWNVKISDELLDELNKLVGVANVSPVFPDKVNL